MTSNGNGNQNGNGSYPGLELDALELDWRSNSRWAGVTRPYSAKDVEQLRGSIHVEHTLARLGAERLWHLLHTENSVRALGAVTGNQAVQQVKGGLHAIYVSGWQVAADANNAGKPIRTKACILRTACRICAAG